MNEPVTRKPHEKDQIDRLEETEKKQIQELELTETRIDILKKFPGMQDD